MVQVVAVAVAAEVLVPAATLVVSSRSALKDLVSCVARKPFWCMRLTLFDGVAASL